MNEIITELNGNIQLIIKIDNPKAVQNIDEYIELADAIYFSRSDLNIKDSLSKICFYQKSIVSKCGYNCVPVIIAGTFLDTMRTLPHPIRAEISDLYNTILQGIDCLLLTAEIISGLYPYEVIDTLNEICSSCEKRVDYSNLFLEILYKTKKPMKVVEAVASSTVKTSFNLQTPIIITVTEKGTAAECVAKYRPYCPVLSLTSKVSIANSLALYRGIFSMIYEDPYNIDSLIAHANEFLLKSKLVQSNTNVVLLSGLNEKKNGTTDQMRVINVNDIVARQNTFKNI
jgi:pyruvate kinase